ncbi:PP2C family protein-serine/threonine phosphatase [Aquibaculum sediminis]|uniref:PP2C family protein-serine/threonine phosphatase n=1 Tax=Aquibaculum sediminis TaxID=3231907 RepID=UPI003453E84E
MSARLRLLLIAGLLLALGVAGSLIWTRSVALPSVSEAEFQVHQREQARLWRTLVEQQSGLLSLAAEELAEQPWLPRLLDQDRPDLLATRIASELPTLERRYGLRSVEIVDSEGRLLYPQTENGSNGQRVGNLEARATTAAGADAEAGDEFAGFRQNAQRDFVLAYTRTLPNDARVIVSSGMDRLLQGISRNGVAPARPAAFADLRGQTVALSGPDEGQSLLRQVVAGEVAVPEGLRLLETPLSDIAERPIGQLFSLLPAEPVSETMNRLFLLTAGLGLALFLLLLLVLARALHSEFAPLDRLIHGVTALAAGDSEVEVPRHAGTDEAGRLSSALQQLRQRALLLTTLEISRERQRRRQERFLRRQLTGLAETLEGKDREALLGDLERLERTARREGAQQSDLLGAADGRLEKALLEPRAGGQDDFALLAVAFENLSFRIRDQNANLKQLVSELNEALRAKSEFLLLQQELDMARSMQLSILPPDRPEQNGLAVHGMMLPAKEVGGDFYDAFELPDGRLALVVADVSGKGVPAAFFSLITRTLLKAIATADAEPRAAIERLNDLLCAENEQMMFVTLFFGLLEPETGRFVYVNGGHNPPLHLRASGEVELLQVTGDMALAVMEEQDYQEREVILEPGDLLLLYTDGVTEACDPVNNEFGEERLLSELRRNQDTPTWMMPQALGNAVKAFENGAAQADDMTILATGYRRGGS